MAKIHTRSGHLAITQITRTEIVPATEDGGYKPSSNFLLKAVDGDVTVTCRLADHSDSESIDLVITSKNYSEELIREIVGGVVEDTLIAGF